jgi:hypothetical protein
MIGGDRGSGVLLMIDSLSIAAQDRAQDTLNMESTIYTLAR